MIYGKTKGGQDEEVDFVPGSPHYEYLTYPVTDLINLTGLINKTGGSLWDDCVSIWDHYRDAVPGIDNFLNNNGDEVHSRTFGYRIVELLFLLPIFPFPQPALYRDCR